MDMSDEETYINAFGRRLPTRPADPGPPQPIAIYTEPPEGATLLLKVLCASCHCLMSTVLEDDQGGLWLRGTDRLREWVPGDDETIGRPGAYWTATEVEQIFDVTLWLYSGCPKSKSPRCGRAYSWSLAEPKHRARLAKARATRRAETIRL